jgi:uncharacterized membrane protein
MDKPLITNDAIILGILLAILSFVFTTSKSQKPFWKIFYNIFPALLLCYFLPSILNTFGIIDGEKSKLYFVASRYLLPSSLVLLTISIDIPEVKKLGSKAIIMFLAGTTGIIVGGPISIFLISIVAPESIGGNGPDAVWRGMSTIAGSWIGGGANQAAMKEIFNVGDLIFSSMIAVDVVVANIWMAILLYGAGNRKKIDKWFQADVSVIQNLKVKIEKYQSQIIKIPDFTDTVQLLAVCFGVTAVAHLGSDMITPYIKLNAPGLSKFSLTSGFFWIIVISTSIALLLSFTKIKNLEGVGASRIGSVFLYILITTIGMKMNIMGIFNKPSLFLMGMLWMFIHVIILISVGKWINAPFFFLAVGSQANVGGAASAPIVASAFHPSLAPVGVLLAVLGYAFGTYGAWLCGVLLNYTSNTFM